MMMHPSLHAVFAAFEAANAPWCLLRPPSHDGASTGDVDLLVARKHARRVQAILERHGFVLLAAHPYVSDRHFVAYDPLADCWIRLHIVTDLSFGRFHALETRAANGCLARRKRDGGWAVLAADDAFWALLLHCLLDKGTISASRQGQLQALLHEAHTDGPLGRCVCDVCSDKLAAARIMEWVRRGEWAQLERFGPVLAACWCRRRPIRVYRRMLLHCSLRVAARVLVPIRRRGLSVALLGPDGCGKTTLARGLQDTFFCPTRPIHMALGDHQIPRLARIRIPKLGAPGRLLVTVWRYAKGQYYQARGWLTVFDRYTYDVLLPSEQRHTWIKQRLRWLLAHAFPPPDLVLLLDAPGHVVYARKNEYNPDHMEAHRQHLLALQPQLSQLRILDATQPKDALRKEAMGVLWQHYLTRWAGH